MIEVLYIYIYINIDKNKKYVLNKLLTVIIIMIDTLGKHYFN